MTEDLTLNMNAYLPLRDVVFNTLREAILKGELKPGERLMELQLAAKLGVSRTPIREAIRMLEQEGLAVTIPRKGAEVARMTEKDMEDVLQIRDALDELAASIACEQISEEELAVYKRGRNANGSHVPKNADPVQYRRGTSSGLRRRMCGFMTSSIMRRATSSWRTCSTICGSRCTATAWNI